MPEPIIVAEGIEKRYGNVVALESVSFEIEPGAIGLLGPNGAGKSTFIKTVLGLLRPDAGTGRVLGLDIRKESQAIRQRIGFMPEDEIVIPRLNAVDYVAYAGRMVGMSATDAVARAHEVLSYCGLEDARARKVEDFSTGMKQRAKLAQAIVHDPALVFLDEPTSGLDPQGRDEMLGLIQDLAHNVGMSVFFSTHILPDVETVCDKVVVLARGRFLAYGRIEDLRKDDSNHLEVRVLGDTTRFQEALESRGCRITFQEGSNLQVVAPGGRDDAAIRPILEAAAASGVQLRRVQPGRLSLEDMFARMIEG